MKYVLVSGGVVSGLGKGITASSLGVLLKGFGLKVTCIKIDPYLNCDAGTMSPFEHGEVYVLDDGGEVDLDMGNYERFLDVSLTKDHNITTGKIYKNVLDKERRGCYLGKTVQVFPHITDEVLRWIEEVAHKPLVFGGDAEVADIADIADIADVCIIELGGTVGDIESGVFVEALRQLEAKVGRQNFVCVLVSFVPSVVTGGEQKSKPTQQSITTLRSLGLYPSIVACRCNGEWVTEEVSRKIAKCAGIELDRVVSLPDVKGGNLWNVPLLMESQCVHLMLSDLLELKPRQEFSLDVWCERIALQWDKLMAIDDAEVSGRVVRIGIVGKYTGNSDAYLSIVKGLQHACMKECVKLEIKWIESTLLEEKDSDSNKVLDGLDGVLIPGGFGSRGVEGMIKACEYCRVEGVPFFGICLGMQVAVIEYCRNVLGIPNANSQEFIQEGVAEGEVYPVIINMPDHNDLSLGGTMRLGLQGTVINPFSIAYGLYQEPVVYERHRHRYEVHPLLVSYLQQGGMTVTGRDERTKERVEIIELSALQHPFYVACQFHPEYKTRPLKPSPLFLGFVKAIKANKKSS